MVINHEEKLANSINAPKAIYIGSDIESFDGPAIIVADSGAGFKMEPNELILPYRTLKPTGMGMGLGLYFANLVMESTGGKMIFPSNEDCSVPSSYTGAIVALVFPKMTSI